MNSAAKTRSKSQRKGHKSQRKDERRRSEFPDLVRAPKPDIPATVFDNAPEVAAAAGLKTDARLRDATASIHQTVDATFLKGDFVTGIGRTGRGLSARTCEHYLPEDRFKWWDVEQRGEIPETGAFSLPKDFCNEFCSSLATVVGSNLDAPSRFKARQVSWDRLQPGSSPNNTPLIEFSVRTLRPESVPTIWLFPLLTPEAKDEAQVMGKNPEPVHTKVLVNAVEDGHVLDPSGARPSLFIDFVVPQRAVGLEFGFLGATPETIDWRHVKLIARNRDGTELKTAEAVKKLFPNDVDNLIGVRHEGGNISSVELRFENSESPILQPQIVYRIWHEPFPPAVIRQGTVEQIFSDQNGAENRELRVQERPPFHCSSAILMVRGFRLEFLDDECHEIKDFHFEIFGRGGTPQRGQFEFTNLEQSSLRIGVRGAIYAKDAEHLIPYKLKVYYTVLAWDPAQMDVFVTRAGASTNGIPLPQPHSYGRIVVQDPCQLRREWEPPGSNVCGEVDSVIHSWRGIVYGVRAPVLGSPYVDQHLKNVMFWQNRPARVRGFQPGSASITPEPIGVSIDIHGPSNSPSTSLIWTMQSKIEGDYERANRWEMSGALLTGSSVLRPVSMYFDFDDFPLDAPLHNTRREQREWWVMPESVSRYNMYAPIEADMAFVSFELMQFWDLDEVRSLDVEVKGHSYDGNRVIWKMGVETQDYDAVLWPRFGGVVRRARRPDTTLSKRDVRFENIQSDVIALAPEQFGFVRNEGNIPIFISEVTKGGEHAREFMPRFQHQERIMSFAELAPLRLDPGESLVIGGRFFTTDDQTDRSAWLEFRTNSTRSPYVVVDIYAQLLPSRAAGALLPEVYNFGNVAVGFHELRTATIQSYGHSPLLVRSWMMQAPAGGMMHAEPVFNVHGLSPTNWIQIEPRLFADFMITFEPTTIGPVEANLVFDTNAGQLTMRLVGTGI